MVKRELKLLVHEEVQR